MRTLPKLFLAPLLCALLSTSVSVYAQDEQVPTDEVQDEPDTTLGTVGSSPVANAEPAQDKDLRNLPPPIKDDEEKIPEPEAPSSIPETRARRAPSTLFGVGLARNSAIGEFNHYDRIYGKPENIGYFQLGYFLYTYGIDLGLSARFGYLNSKGAPLRSLTADGQTLETPLEGDIPSNYQTDSRQRVELTLIPVQTLLEVAYSPFPVSRRIVLRGYIGPEFLYVQEVLKPNIPSTQSVPAGTQLVSKGWNRGLVTGAMVSICISGIEARSDYALKSIGVDRTYISPFMEIVKTTNAKYGNYDRNSYGISLQFEGLR